MIVFVLLAAILMLVGITAVSAIDFTHDKRPLNSARPTSRKSQR